MAHEPCDVDGPRAEPVDVNGDQIPDVVRVRSASGQASCRATDLTFDGRPDVYDYFAEDGAVRRTERDLDGDGRIDVVVVDCTTYADADGDGTADSIEPVAGCH